jgi:hypothetical protein
MSSSWGQPYAELVKALDEAAAETETPVLGFYRMTVGQIRRRTALPLTLARLAKQREYDEPFEIRGTARPDPLLAGTGTARSALDPRRPLLSRARRQ